MKIYTDGSSKKNGTENQIGGWAFCVIDDNDNLIYEKNGSVINATNNQMEIMAFLEAAYYINNNEIRKLNEEEIEYYIDSAYVVNCIIDKWYEKWRKNGWLNSKYEPVKNKQLWINLLDELEKHNYSINKVKGHSLDKWNNYVDKLAVKSSTQLQEENNGRSNNTSI